MAQPLISVCIVTYNHQAYIADCLMSVLGQRGDFRLEIIVGDDASSDATAAVVQAIAEQYPGIIRLFIHPQNIGPSQNLHFTIAQAQGDFIAHLDGDDFWLPGKLQAQLTFLQTYPDCPACYTNAMAITHEKIAVGYFNPRLPERMDLDHLLQAGNFLNNSSMLYRATYRAPLLDLADQLIDYRIHLSFAQQGAIGFLNMVLTAYRTNSTGSQMTTLRSQVLRLYVDALLSMETLTNPAAFKAAILAFYRVYFLNLHLNYDSSTRTAVLEQLQAHYPLRWTTVTFAILPFTLWSELKGWLYKKTVGRQLRFLQRNGAN